jgi:prepilin-type N-terminal cleavage/methylation domain-containing protein
MEVNYRISDFKSQISNLKSQTRRHGFTLVEMLTVIVIISILAGLVVVAAVPAIRRARESTIRQDIAQLEMALVKYKQERGDFPPDFAGVGDINGTIRTAARQDVIRHLRKAFPRFRIPGATPDDQWNQLRVFVKQASGKDQTVNLTNVDTAPGMDINQITPGSALVFWLGGPTDLSNASANKLVGFSANPANPFAIGGSRLDDMFDEFDETRLLGTGSGGNPDASGIVQYVPPHVVNPDGGNPPPYVYFRARSNGYVRDGGSGWLGGDKHGDEEPTIPSLIVPGCGTCAPYAASKASDSTNFIFRWKNPKTFQIICSGLDGHFGENPPDPTADGTVRFLDEANVNILPQEDDNITSFTQGKLIDRAEE